MVNHDAPHQLSGRRDKVGSALPDRLHIIDQPQVGFVENGGGLQRVASALPAHVMMREPVQFGLHQREQLLHRSLICTTPVAEQLGDLLSRGRGRRHTGCSTPHILTRPRDFHSADGADQKKLRSRGGFGAAFPLYHMNRHKQTEAGKPKQKANLKQERPMQTKQSVTNSNNHQPSTACREKHAAIKLPIRSTVIAAFGLLSTLLPVSQTAHAQDTRSREFVAPVVFQAAGSTAASIQSTVDAFRAAVGDPNNGNNPGPLKNGRREINWDGGNPNVLDTTAPVTPFNVFLNT